MTAVEFRMLGTFEVYGVGGSPRLRLPPRQSVVLATLLAFANRGVTVEQLGAAAFPAPPRALASNVRTQIAALRRAFEQAGDAASRLATEAYGYRLTVRPGELDLMTFDSLVAAGDAAESAADHQAAAQCFADALALWRGSPLTGLACGPLLVAEIARLEQRRLLITERWADAALALGQSGRVAEALAGLVRDEPLREGLWERLILALYRSGRQAEALAAYQQVYRLLDRQLGVAPSPALQRLHQRVLAADPLLDPRVAERVEPTPPPRTAKQLPASISLFVGRDAELKQLDSLLPDPVGCSPGTTIIASVAGPAGVGKTALAVRWAHRVSDSFPDGQLYIDLRGYGPSEPMPPQAALDGLLRALGVAPAAIPAGLDEQSALFRSQLAGRRVLVLLDNVRSAGQIRPMLPGAPGCLVLVTSRDHLSGLVARDGAHRLNLEPLPEPEAVELVRCVVGDEWARAEPESVARVAWLCAGLPLALRVAAERARRRPGTPLADLATELADQARRLDVFDIPQDPASAVREVFSWSYVALPGPLARLFRLLGMHPGPDIGEAAAASLAGVPVRQVRPMLAELASVHLIAEREPGRFTLHDLLRAYARELAETPDTEAESRAALGRLLDHYVHAANAAARLLNPVGDPAVPPLEPPPPGVVLADLTEHGQAMAWFTAERAGLLAAIECGAARGFEVRSWQISQLLTHFLDRRGHWRELAASQQTAAVAARRLAHRPAEVRAYRSLARALIRLGRLDEANSFLERALDLLGTDEQDQQASRSNRGNMLTLMASVCGRQRRHREAIDHAVRAHAEFVAVEDAAGQARTLNIIGWYQAQLGEFERALDNCERALALRQGVTDPAGQADTLHSIGYVHLRLGRHREAADYYGRALEIYRELGDRLNEADTLDQLGDTHLAAGDPDAARRSWQRALTILDGLAHANAARIRAKLQP